MTGSEIEFVRWLQANQRPPRDWTRLGVGDDMAILEFHGATVLVTTDMLLDGVHFSIRDHSLEAIGRKAIACSLSDCAAMAVRPLAATVSVALPRTFPPEGAGRLFRGLRAMADAFDCDIVGGDTTCWPQPLAIDVCLIATPYPGIEPRRRSGAQPGDELWVTGRLGGSLEGGHLVFTPRVREARRIAETLGRHLHALMDISDGLSLDLHRMCEASGVGAVLFRDQVLHVADADAHRAGERDGRSVLCHVLEDGEDFELLAAIDPAGRPTDDSAQALGLTQVGLVTRADVVLQETDGTTRPLEPHGYDHFHG